jgi:hypothetical protein
VEYEISREDRPPLPFNLWRASGPVQVINRSSKVWPAFPVGENEFAPFAAKPLMEHGRGPISKRDNAAAIFALAVSHSQKPKAGTIDRRLNDYE